MADRKLIIFQFKIRLESVKPTVWRRIEVPGDYNFWDLHVAIQDSMGWSDAHLHEFKIANPIDGKIIAIGIPDDDYDWSRATLPGWQIAIADYFTMDNREATYNYDFGDDWQHRIRLESIGEATSDQQYPRCVAGKMACPPEDVGGPWGYQDFLAAINDPDHDQHEELLEWVGGSFDAELFDPGEVWFDDPKARWQVAIGEEDAA